MKKIIRFTESQLKSAIKNIIKEEIDLGQYVTTAERNGLNESKPIRINESKFRQIVKESVRRMLNEGPGAGYTMSFNGLKADNIQIIKKDENNIYFKGDIVPSVVKWSAEGYYGGPSNEGVWYDNDIVEEYDDEENTVNGGTIEGCIDAEYWDGREDYECQDYIAQCLSDFGFEQMVGGGYSHTNLDNPMVFNGFQVNCAEDYIFIDQLTLDAQGIVDNCNWWFENWSSFDEIYGREEDVDSLDEAIDRAIRKRLK